MINWYFALVDQNGTAHVTLPNPKHGVSVGSDGTIEGAKGAEAMWNGPPPPWCTSIAEVKSPHGWYKVEDSEKTVIWSKEPDPTTAFHDHLDVCRMCRDQPFRLCPVGNKALRTQAEALKGTFKTYGVPGLGPDKKD